MSKRVRYYLGNQSWFLGYLFTLFLNSCISIWSSQNHCYVVIYDAKTCLAKNERETIGTKMHSNGSTPFFCVSSVS
jgi:hypothetical protein